MTTRRSSRSARSLNEANGRLRRSSRIDSAAWSPTPLIAARPKRIAEETAAKFLEDSLMSGGSTGIPISTQSPITLTIPSVEPISAESAAARKSTG